ncbi:MAG: hypothetical protein DCC75_11355 [Proteobacteria bacterium]|nr:MAG: hypothetical protein DCC75_11355 [Pseudomonadota bacterium]
MRDHREPSAPPRNGPLLGRFAIHALILLAHASQASDGTAKGIREYLSTMEPLAGISGPLSFDQAGDIRQESFIIVAAEQHLGL